MSAGTSWTPDEDDVLRERYATYGGHWHGWRELLPGRTEKAIVEHARRLGLHHPRKRGRDYDLTRAEMTALQAMHEGFAPSQIDERHFWVAGRARALVVSAWSKDSESKWGLLGRR